MRRRFAGLLLGLPLLASAELARELPVPGGQWTRDRQPVNTLIAPAEHLTRAEELDFYTGMSFFRSPWVTAPSSTTARDGLGPLFNAHSCEGCHPNGGRGPSLLDRPDSVATVVRLSIETKRGEVAHPFYGDQIQTRAVWPDGWEAKVSLTSTELPRRLTEDEQMILRQPTLGLSWGPAGDPGEILTSVRVPPPLIGLGLLESISDGQIQALEDVEDANNDGISGRVHWRPLAGTDQIAVGRFGWKGMHPTVNQQVAAAFRDDLGITTPLSRGSVCALEQTRCAEMPNGNDPVEGVEIVQLLFDYVTFFTRHIPPPSAGKLSERAALGQRLFREVQCDGCHQPSFTTSEGTFWPYTDLLLHDMGEELADGRREGDADGREWRTPPLWGIGTMKKVAGHTTLLHDGRARNVTEAILWHGGEAASSRARFQALPRDSQRALVVYVNAL
ncbi:MAG: di-heme oxidoredictase family protein [Pseudomonadota bacterium]